jgi:adenylate cyclase
VTNDHRSVLFVDVCDSTKLLESLGDVRGRAVVLQCLALMRSRAEEHGGTIVDQIGDELMMSFEAALSAVHGACAMQVAVTNAVMAGALPPGVHVRIGFHHGPVVIHDGSVFGKTVHLARRVASASKAQQIVVSRQVLDECPATAGIKTRYLERSHVKGHVEPLELHEILWDDSLGTIVDTEIGAASPWSPTRQLRVTFRDARLEVTERRPVITVGRGEACDLVIRENKDKVSRLHGRFEFRKGSFYFVDASANGSEVRLDDAPAEFIRRDEVRLTAAGTISLGASADAPLLAIEIVDATPEAESR